MVIGKQYSFIDLLHPEFPNIDPGENSVDNIAGGGTDDD
jgi:hypothetical protein